MKSFLNRIKRSLAMRGPMDTVKLCASNVLGLFHPEARKIEKLRQQLDEEFDQSWGVDTSGIHRPDKQGVRGENWSYGIRYQGVDPVQFSQVLSGLKLSFKGFSFVDFGSGKGRALLLASQYRFQSVIGIEYCEDLHGTAQRNLLRFDASKRQCAHLQSICMDAAQYELPQTPLVLFFFNPFGRPVMEKVVQNVIRSHKQNPRHIIVVYFTPYHADLWESTGFLVRVKDDPAVFDSDPKSSRIDSRENVQTFVGLKA